MHINENEGADSPPRTEYKPTDPKVEGKSLLDLQLAPSSALLIRFSKETLNGTLPFPRESPFR